MSKSDSTSEMRVGLSRVGCVRFSRVNLISVLFYLTFGAGVTLDVISQHISVFGRRFCGDRRLTSRVLFLSLHSWNFNESKKDLDTSHATSRDTVGI